MAAQLNKADPNATGAQLRTFEGPGNKYLIQHSAGSGKSNSIAWTAHQLSSLYDGGSKVFESVIIVTDRTVLDDQLQETIYQFEHVDGVVGRINREESDGSKSESRDGPLLVSLHLSVCRILVVSDRHDAAYPSYSSQAQPEGPA
ncbi:DEAD/DEAH box helicase family protein [Pseudophaeobacter sp.]|uniref:DEAD/DEAH box helicase family protein n=1 Tax=Pseudophaeobacter sp. TaxID=1971739 RepID=UPI003298CB3D